MNFRGSIKRSGIYLEDGRVVKLSEDMLLWQTVGIYHAHAKMDLRDMEDSLQISSNLLSNNEKP